MAKKHVGWIAVIAFGASFVTNAQNLAGSTAVDGEVGTSTGKKPLPFMGSTLSYTHTVTALTLAPEGEPRYNPTYVHRLGILPEWHFNDLFFARARFWLSQELTLSDSTTTPYEFEPSDVWLEAGTTGYLEKNSRIRISGDLRLTIPTSKVARAQSRILGLAPGLVASRSFSVLSGLFVSYAARFHYRFNRFTTTTAQNSPISCGDPTAPACTELLNVGNRNINFDLLHGPVVTFLPTEKLIFSANFMMQHGWLYPTSETVVDPNGNVRPIEEVYPNTPGLTGGGANVRNFNMFGVSATYVLFKPVALTFGSFTFAPQTGEDGKFLFPLFNRFTTLYLDVSVDIEAAVSSLL